LLSWREPKDVKGPFTATIKLNGPFKIETKPFTTEESEKTTSESQRGEPAARKKSTGFKNALRRFFIGE